MAQPPTKRKVMGRIDLAQTSPPPRSAPTGSVVRASINHTLSPTASSTYGASSGAPGSVGRKAAPRARVDMSNIVGMSPVATPSQPPAPQTGQARPAFATPESAPALRRFGSSTSSVTSISSLGPSAFARVTTPQATAGPSTPRTNLNGAAAHAASPAFVRSPVVQEEDAQQFSPSNVTVRKDRRRLMNRSIDASTTGSPTFSSAFAAETAGAAAGSSTQAARRPPNAVRGHVRATTSLASPASFNVTPTPSQPLRANAFGRRSPAHRSRTPSPGPDVPLQPGPLRRSGPLATPYDSPVASTARSRENSYSADSVPVRPAQAPRKLSEGASTVSSTSAGGSSSTSASGQGRAIPGAQQLSLPQAGTSAFPRSPGAPFASLIETGLLSPTSESGMMLSPAEAYEAAEARVHRRLLDLEITNKSLLVINDGLEKTKLRQSKEISDLRRRLRDGRFAVGAGGLGSAMGLSGPHEELEDDDDDFEDAEEGAEEDPELEASHQRCNTLINNLLAQARASIVSRYEEEAKKGGNRVLHPIEMRELEEQRLKEQDELAADQTADQTDTADSTRLLSSDSAETSVMESSSSIEDLSHASGTALAVAGDTSQLSNDDGDSTSMSLSSSIASLDSADTASDATETQEEPPLAPSSEAGDVSID